MNDGLFADRPGKTAVNYGNKPVEIDVILADGKSQSITVPPGKGVALPTGATTVHRGFDSIGNKDSENAKVQIEGDGKQVPLNRDYKNVATPELGRPPPVVRGTPPAIVTLDPGRPEVIRPVSEAAQPGEKKGFFKDPDPSQFTSQPGKTVVNYGKDPVAVTVNTADGKSQYVTVPPGKGVALPPSTTSVERDFNSMWNKTSESAKVQVEGDGKQVPLNRDDKKAPPPITGRPVSDTHGVPPAVVTLDPDRPEVVRPISEPAKPGESKGFFNDPDSSQFTSQPGKTVVNHGDKPVEVTVKTADGKSQYVTVPPGQGVALPPGTTSVERDNKSVGNKASENVKVQVEGDGKEVPLNITNRKPDAPPTVVNLDPNRPEVVRPSAEPVKPGERNGPFRDPDSSQFTSQPGKTVVNHGDKPVEVTITTADGEKKDIVIPPGTGVALPPGTTSVERDNKSEGNKASENVKVEVAGDGKEVPLNVSNHKADAPPTVVNLDPNRPEVVRPDSTPVKPPEHVGGGGGVEGPDVSSQFTGQPGKTVVNHGDKPVEVTVTTADGEKKDIMIPPGTGVALPPGTTSVERDTKSRWNKESEGAKVEIAGDGKEVPLNPTGHGRDASPAVVNIDPNRPEVVRPGSEPIKPPEHTGGGGGVEGPDVSSQFTGQPGKTVVNHGDKPVEVTITTADGEKKDIVVPPGQGVALPPGTTSVERDTKSRGNRDSEGAKVEVAGDGKEVPLNPTGHGRDAPPAVVNLDPNRPEVVRPGTTSNTDAAKDKPDGTAHGGTSPKGEKPGTGTDLKDGEAQTGDGKGGKGSQDAKGILDGLVDTVAGKNTDKTTGGFKVNKGAQDMNTASTAGDDTLDEAKNTTDKGGKDAGGVRDKSTSEIAKGDAEDSWSKAIGDALQTGLTAGGAAFGTAVGGGLADKATKEIFDKNKHGGKSGTKGGTGSGGSSSSSSSSSSSHSGSSHKGGSHSSGGSSAPPPGTNAPTSGTNTTGTASGTNAPTAGTNTTTTTTTPTPTTADNRYKCPVCGSKDTTYVGTYYMDGSAMYHCNGCGGTVHDVSGW